MRKNFWLFLTGILLAAGTLWGGPASLAVNFFHSINGTTILTRKNVNLQDDKRQVFGETSPTFLSSQIAGQTTKNFAVASISGTPLVILNSSDLGSNVFATDISPFLIDPAIWFPVGSPIVPDFGVAIGSNLGNPNEFEISAQGGDTIGGTPRNLPGIGMSIQAGNGGSLGGVAGKFSIQAGSAVFGNQDGGDVSITGGGASGTGLFGKIRLGGIIRLENSGGSEPALELPNSNVAVSNLNEARIRFNAGVIEQSINANPYIPLGGGGGDLVSATLATASGATAATIPNSTSVTFDIPASGVDSGNHRWIFSTAGQFQFQVQGTFNGTGGLASGLLVFGTPNAPSAFNWIGGDAVIPATNALDWIYAGGKGGHNNPGFDAGRGSNFQITSGGGGDGPDNSHAPGAAGSIDFHGAQGGAGNPAFVGGEGGTITLLSGAGGVTGGAGAGNYGNVNLVANAADISLIGANSTIINTVAAGISNAWQVRDNSGGNLNYLQANTSIGSESVVFGNIVTNPSYQFLGTGTVQINGSLHNFGPSTLDGLVTINNKLVENWPSTLAAGSESMESLNLSIVDPGSDSTANFTGVDNIVAQLPWSHDLNGEMLGSGTTMFAQPGPGHVTNAITAFGAVTAVGTAGTVNQINGYTSFMSNPGAATIGVERHFYAKNSSGAAEQRGLYIEDLTGAAINYGVVIDGATDQAIWVKGGHSQFDDAVAVSHTGSGSAVDVTETITPVISSTNYAAAYNMVVNNPAANNGSSFVGFLSSVGTGSTLTHNMTGTFYGMQNEVAPDIGIGNTLTKILANETVAQNVGAGTVTTAIGTESIISNGTGNLTNGTNYHIRNGTNGGTYNNQTGIEIDNLTTAANNYGLVLNGASTRSLWSKSGNVEFDGINLQMFLTNTDPAQASILSFGSDLGINQGQIFMNGSGNPAGAGNGSFNILAGTGGGGILGLFAANNSNGIIMNGGVGSNVWKSSAIVGPGSIPWIKFTPGDDTAVPNAEKNDIQFNFGRILTFLGGGGAIATQRAFEIDAPTYAAAAPQTITNAATVSIAGAPIAGANVTITNRYGLLCSGDASISARHYLGNQDVSNLTLFGESAIGGNFYGYAVDFGTPEVYVNNSLVAFWSSTLMQVGVNGHFLGHFNDFSPVAETSGSQGHFVFTAAANTNRTASTEVVNWNFNDSAVQTWATGAIATQREMIVQAPTYAFNGASTITNAATVAISGAPIAGANATLTNSWALWIQGGRARFDGGTLTSGHVSTTGTTPSLGACGGAGVGVVGNDNAGVITVGAGLVTSCTLNFATTWSPNPPVCVISDNSTAITGDVSSVSTSNVVFSFSASLGGGTIYYHCMGYE